MPRGKRAAVANDLDQAAELAAVTEAPAHAEAPESIGGFATPPPPEMAEPRGTPIEAAPDASVAETPEPSSPDEPEPTQQDDAPGPDDAAPISADTQWQEALRERDTQLEMVRRELEFVRQGQQAPQQPHVDPLLQQAQQIFGTINEETVAIINAGGPRAAEIIQQGLTSAYLLARTHAREELSQAYQGDVQQRTQADGIRNAFWSQNDTLRPYERIVLGFAQEVAAEAPQRRFSAEQAIREVGTRTRTYLKGIGIDPDRQRPAATGRSVPVAVGPRPIAARPRPAFADMGGGRSGTARPMNDVQRALNDMVALRS